MSRPPRIKTIIPASETYFAAFSKDEEHEIGERIEKILCWSLIEYFKPDEPDEVVGQIIAGDTITEVTNVDHEEGFGEFIGYFESRERATHGIMTFSALEDEDEGEDLDRGDEDEDEEDADDEEEDEGEDWDDEDEDGEEEDEEDDD